MYRSDVVGSLLRPAYLKEARERHGAGELSDAAFKQIEDRAVAEAIELQDRAGVEVVTDGEMRRYAFYGHLVDAVEGYDKLGGWAIPFRNEKGEDLINHVRALCPNCGASGICARRNTRGCARRLSARRRPR